MIEGSIIDPVDETMDFLKKHISVRFVITGKPQRDEIQFLGRTCVDMGGSLWHEFPR